MSNAPPKYKRSFKNYIVDSRFQLKYTLYTLILSLFIAAPLGGFLFQTSGNLVQQSERVAAESKKVSEAVRNQMAKDYPDDPELMKTYAAQAGGSDAEVVAQQRAVVQSQRNMRIAVVGGLSLLVVLITIMGIYFTHKVAGPIYKMKLLLGQVGDGKLNFRGGLRKGDELQSFFEAFATMVARIKERRSADVDTIEAAIEKLRASAPDADVSALQALRDTMKTSLDA
jgi:sensor histidine kinase YesM